MTKYYYSFIILFLVSTFLVLSIKGYFNILAFNIENNRPDIERYANSKLTSESFFTVDSNFIEKDILKKFNDVEKVSVRKNLNMTITLIIFNKKAFGKVNDTTYLSDNGRIFYSKLKFDKDLPTVIVKDFSLNNSYLSEDQMSFIKSLKGYPKINIYLLSPFGFTITSDIYNIEVPVNFENTESMANFVNSEIAKRGESLVRLVVLKDKIVFKK